MVELIKGPLNTKGDSSWEDAANLLWEINNLPPSQQEKKNELFMLKSNNFITINDNKIIVNKNKFGVLNQIILKLLP